MFGRVQMLKLQYPVMRRFSQSAFQLLQRSRPASASASATASKPEIAEKTAPVNEIPEDVVKIVKQPSNTGYKQCIKYDLM